MNLFLFLTTQEVYLLADGAMHHWHLFERYAQQVRHQHEQRCLLKQQVADLYHRHQQVIQQLVEITRRNQALRARCEAVLKRINDTQRRQIR